MRRTTQRELAKNVTLWEAKHLVAGEKLHLDGDLRMALRKYAKVLNRNARCWPVVFNAAVLAHTLCDHEWAITQLQRCVKALPGFCEAWYNLGTMQQCVGQYAGPRSRCNTPSIWIRRWSARASTWATRCLDLGARRKRLRPTRRR